MRETILLFALAALGHAASGTLSFDKLARFDRPAEPVAVGIPFPKGVLRQPEALRLADAGRDLPVQATATARWPDGSIRWLFVRTLVDLPANAGKQIQWTTGQPPQSRPAEAVRVRRAADGSLEVDAGALAATVPAAGFFPFTNVRLNRRPAGPERSAMRGFTLRSGGHVYSTADAGPVKLEVLEEGPVAAVLRASGRHGGPDSPFDFSAVLTFWRGKPYVQVDYRATAMRGGEETSISSWTWEAQGTAVQPQLRMSGPDDAGSPQSVSYVYAPKKGWNSDENRIQSFAGDFWCDWSGAQGGLAVTIRHAQQNNPKGMEATPERLVMSLYPALDEPLRFPFGAAKTHQMLFHFHPAGISDGDLKLRSMQFQIPDVAKLDDSWYGECRVWDERVFEGPRSRRVEALVYDIVDDRPFGFGLWNFGDEVQWGYTEQGRGGDEVVWLNNEYDFVHLMFLEYARTGERRFLDYAAVSALHWRDVDVAHAAKDAKKLGGHIIHSARHVTGGTTPSHQWVEGLFDAYHMLGDREAYLVAIGIGENILRAMQSDRYRDPANSATRDMGWALRAMLALHRETGEQKYADAAHSIAKLFLRWHKEVPGLLQPGGSHFLGRATFMNSLTLVSLAYYLRHFPSDEMKRLVLEETDDLIRAARNRNGIFYYKEPPYVAYQDGTAIVLELLGEAYTISGDRRYLEAGLAHLERAVERLHIRIAGARGSPAKIRGVKGGYTPGGKTMGTALMPMLSFLHAAKDTDIAGQIDYQLRLH